MRGGTYTHWIAPPSHGARGTQPPRPTFVERGDLRNFAGNTGTPFPPLAMRPVLVGSSTGTNHSGWGAIFHRMAWRLMSAHMECQITRLLTGIAPAGPIIAIEPSVYARSILRIALWLRRCRNVVVIATVRMNMNLKSSIQPMALACAIFSWFKTEAPAENPRETVNTTNRPEGVPMSQNIPRLVLAAEYKLTNAIKRYFCIGARNLTLASHPYAGMRSELFLVFGENIVRNPINGKNAQIRYTNSIFVQSTISRRIAAPMPPRSNAKQKNSGHHTDPAGH
jgi:hypothetical protein